MLAAASATAAVPTTDLRMTFLLDDRVRSDPRRRRSPRDDHDGRHDAGNTGARGPVGQRSDHRLTGGVTPVYADVAMDFQLLGPFEARDSGRPVAVASRRQERLLLAVLLLEAGQIVSIDRLT